MLFAAGNFSIANAYVHCIKISSQRADRCIIWICSISLPIKIDIFSKITGINAYALEARAGQVMTVTLLSPHQDVWLSLMGDDGSVLTSILSETVQWAGELPATQDYVIRAVAAGGETPYTMRLELVGEGESPPEPTPEPAATNPAPNEHSMRTTWRSKCSRT